MKPQNLNLFKIGDVIDIPGVEKLSGLEIVNINDCGVAVKGVEVGPYYVISGSSPAIYHIPKIINESVPQVEETYVEKKIRISAQEKVSKIKTPEKQIFTIKEVAEFNDVATLYATNWVKENCIEAGKAEKKDGQRGKTAMLYKLKIV